MSCLYFLLLNLFFVDSNSEVVFELPAEEVSSDMKPTSERNDFKPRGNSFDSDHFFDELRSAPDSNSAILLKLNSLFQIFILREDGDWIEADALSPENFEFRGWIKKKASAEPKLEREISVIQKDRQNQISPIKGEMLRWFWESDWTERGEWGLPLGIQNIQLAQNGITEEDGRVSIPGYQFSSFSLGSFLRFSVFETYWRQYRSRLRLEASYQWAFYQVRFASNFDPIDVAGDAYSLQTHRYQAQLWQDMRFFMNPSFSIAPALGFGYFYFETAPQLKRTNAGDIIFTENSLYAFLTSLQFQLDWKNKIQVIPIFHLPVLSQIKETPSSFSGSGDKTFLKKKGLPLFVQLEADYKWSSAWSTGLKASYIRFQGQHPGPTKRVDQVYESAKIRFSNWELLLNLKFYF